MQKSSEDRGPNDLTLMIERLEKENKEIKRKLKNVERMIYEDWKRRFFNKMKTIPDAIDDIKKLIKKCLDVFYAVVERNSSKLNVWSWNKRWRNRDKGTGYGS